VLLTITTTRAPATDLGYLLHKHPARFQTFELGWGNAHVFYPEASEARCTAALLLEVDPVGLVRGRRWAAGPLAQYVNDRPYVASSFLSVALAQVYRSALAGACKERPELVKESLPLEARLPAVPCRGGEETLRKMFEPLGYEVEARRHALDASFPEWGESPYFSIALRGTVPLCDLLSHLYVLIPVLDAHKHYWVDEPEVEKLLAKGGAWLASHPEREFITRRYLSHRRRLVDEALAQLAGDDPLPEEEETDTGIPLNEQRLKAVVEELKACGARRVLDLGCGEGALLGALLADASFTEIVGLDASPRALRRAKERLRWEQLPPRQQARVHLMQGSLTYRDARLNGYDAAAVVEVVEHLHPARLGTFAFVLFGCARPKAVVITTPNAECNREFPDLKGSGLRHADHRFEWTRPEFQAWANAAAAQYGYEVRFASIGAARSALGAPTQMAVFTRDTREPRPEQV